MWKKWLNVYFTYLLISVYMFVRGEISPSTYARRETSLVAWMCRLQFFPFSLSIHFRKYSFLWDNQSFPWDNNLFIHAVILTDDRSPHTCDMTYLSHLHVWHDWSILCYICNSVACCLFLFFKLCFIVCPFSLQFFPFVSMFFSLTSRDTSEQWASKCNSLQYAFASTCFVCLSIMHSERAW